jgi:hypothetical protein
MRSSSLCRAVVLLVGVWLGLALLPGPAAAKYTPPKPAYTLPEEKQPSAVVPWFIGGGLVAITIVASIKNAKRTHLD